MYCFPFPNEVIIGVFIFFKAPPSLDNTIPVRNATVLIFISLNWKIESSHKLQTFPRKSFAGLSFSSKIVSEVIAP